MADTIKTGLLPADDTMFAIESLDLTVSDMRHPFHAREHEAAARNWALELAANPALFDGEVLLQHDLSIRDGRVASEGSLVPFSIFLWWRRQVTPFAGHHVFGFALPVSSDGALIAIRMGPKTANAGQVYCAAGSLDRADIVDGRCDMLANMAREVGEETGLDLGQAEDEGRYFGSYARRRLLVCRRFHFRQTAEELVESVNAHMRDEADPEISGVVAIRSADPDAHAYNPVMLPLLRWFFGSGT